MKQNINIVDFININKLFLKNSKINKFWQFL